MRKVVSFSFYPEGYDWVEPTPAILSEGCSGTFLLLAPVLPLLSATGAPELLCWATTVSWATGCVTCFGDALVFCVKHI